jgi:hypothetical protein
MMRLGIFALLIAVLAETLAAQVPSILLLSPDTAWRSKSMMAFVGGEAGIRSNALDVEFLGKSILGGHLDRDHLERLAKDMPQHARLGYGVGAQLELYNFRDTLFGNANIGLCAALSTNYQGYASFAPNLFRTVYLGNSATSGTTVPLGPVVGGTQAWQKFGIGFFNKSSLSSFTVSLIEGQSYQSLKVNQADLYTSALGDSLTLFTDACYYQSDTTRMGWANGSGLGASVDFDFNLPLSRGKELVSLSVRNLGFVAWNEKSEKVRAEMPVDWYGLNVTDYLSGASDTLTLPNWKDSLQEKRVNDSFVKLLPASVRLRYVRHWKGNSYLETGVGFTPNAASVPEVYVGYLHSITKRLMLSGRMVYGGYGGFALGAELQWLSSHSWFVRAGSMQLEGWLLPTAGGRNVYLNLGKNF